MDLTREILFNETPEETDDTVLEVSDEETSDQTQEIENPVVNVELESGEILIEHGFDTVVVNITKLKDQTIKGILTKYKDALAIVPTINDDFLNVVENGVSKSIGHTVTEGCRYVIYTDHQVKG